MSIEIACAGCGSKLRVSDEHRGKQARCPKCGTIQTVPGGEFKPAFPANPNVLTPGTSVGTNLGAGGVLGTVGPTAAQNGNQYGASPPSYGAGNMAYSNQPQATPAYIAPAAPPQQTFAPNSTITPGSDYARSSWFVRTPDGIVYGPATRFELDEWVRESRVSKACLIRHGDGAWSPATVYYSGLPDSAPAAYASVPHNSATPNVTYSQDHRGTLILLLAIFGIIFTPCAFLSVVAWVMGAKDLEKIKTGVMNPAGLSTTQVGYYLGMIWSVIVICGMVIGMLVAMANS